jgi:hypothetical protein
MEQGERLLFERGRSTPLSGRPPLRRLPADSRARVLARLSPSGASRHARHLLTFPRRISGIFVGRSVASLLFAGILSSTGRDDSIPACLRPQHGWYARLEAALPPQEPRRASHADPPVVYVARPVGRLAVFGLLLASPPLPQSSSRPLLLRGPVCELRLRRPRRARAAHRPRRARDPAPLSHPWTRRKRAGSRR